MNFSVLGTGSYVPERIVTNSELSKIVDTSDEWITQRIGVLQRHICTEENTSDLAYKAALNAVENSGCKAEDIDLILAATISGENSTPSVSCMVQQKLGINCPAFDINAACSSFIFLLETAAGFFARGIVKKVLVVGAERMSGIVDWTDRNTCVIFGDGAGAMVLGEGDSYLSSTLNVKGGDEVIKVPNFIGKSPYYEKEGEAPYIQMKGQETFKFAVNSICNDITKVLLLAGIDIDTVTHIVPHQANIRIIDFACKKLNIPINRFYVNIENYGNTSSASIPLAVDEMNRKGIIKRGDTLVFAAFGGGLSSAACVLKW